MKIRKIIFTTALSALVCFGLCQQMQSATDTPDPGPLTPSNTADGQSALGSLTTGLYNSAFGFLSLLSNADANFNTGVGAGVLLVNTASENTAVGAGALFSNVDGSDNNAVGAFALFNNVSGSFNNAHGRDALLNSTGDQNNAMGDDAMFFNTTGSFNTAIGDDALDNNVDGNSNVAIGDEAGTGLGPSVNNCIAIGVPGAGTFATFDNTCFIGSIFDEPVSDPGTQEAVFVDQFNVVGIQSSSRRFKHDIQPMDKEVAGVNPDLVVQKNGEISTVRYEQVNVMLLNEFLKEHKKVETQQATIAELKSTVAQQQKGMEVLTAQLKEQGAQIQKVSAQLEVGKPAAKVVLKNP